MLGSFLHSVRYGFFDMFTQFYLLYTGKQEKFNFKRATTFFIFGACFSVYYDYVFYSRFYVYLQKSWGLHPVGLVFIENNFTAPFLWCPVFYFVQEFIEVPNGPSIYSAWETTKKNMVGDIKALWAVWGPFHLISFMWIHPMMRPAFAASVGIIWTVGWSLFRGDIAKNQGEETTDEKSLAVAPTEFALQEPPREETRKNLLPGDDVREGDLMLPPVVAPDQMKEALRQAETELGVAAKQAAVVVQDAADATWVVADTAQPSQKVQLQG